MKAGRCGVALSALALALSACGGGGGGNGNGGSNPPPTGVTPPPPPPATAACSLQSRQEWAAGQIRENYLFPETLPASLSTAGFATVNDYVDALTATARAQRRDRFFTYVTSIQEENAFFNSGSSAGFGIRLSTDTGAQRLFIAEAFENAPALNAGLDRGTEILAIGTSVDTLRSIQEILTARPDSGITDALGASTPGLTRTLRVRDAGGERNVTLSKADFQIAPVSPRYGARVIEDGGRRVGYLNLRTFIGPADPALRDAVAGFRAQGITEVIVDFRYNGGGLVRVAELMGDLLGGNRSPSEVYSYTVFRPEKASNNETRFFRPLPQSIGATKIAFIGTRGTASASEEVINAFIPYLRTNMALVGTNTFGKPVGQIAIDRAACDDRLRVVAFAVQNANRQGDYYDGLAPKVDVTCQASDDILRPLGDPQEASTRAALDFLAGRSCTRIGEAGTKTLAQREAPRELLSPDQPSAAQREVPGLF